MNKPKTSLNNHHQGLPMPITFLQELITYPTITPKECGIYKHILDKLQPIVQSKGLDSLIIEQEKAGVKNLFFAIIFTLKLCVAQTYFVIFAPLKMF